MKYKWTKEEIMDNRGCYSEDQVEGLSFINNPEINLVDILESEISIRDKVWFIRNNSEFSIKQKTELAFLMAKSVTVLFNNKYPEDSRVNACLEGIEKFNQGLISRDELYSLRHAASAAADAAAYAYADAAYAADAAAYAYADAAYAADAAAYAADAADAAAYAAYDADVHSIALQNVIIDFIKSQS